MQDEDCQFCDKTFASKFNRKRHELLFHADEEDNKHPTSGKRKRQQSDSSDNSTDSSSDEYEEEQTGWDDEDAWDNLIEAACEKFPEKDLQTAEELLQEPHIGEFLNALHDIINERINLARHLEDENEVYSKINKTAKKYLDSDEGYSKEEAFNKAWKERSALLTELLVEHEDTINKHYFGIDNEDDQ